MASVMASPNSAGPEATSTSSAGFEAAQGAKSVVPTNPMDELDEASTSAPPPTLAPSNTPVTGDSGQTSPVLENSSDGLSDEGHKEKQPAEDAPPLANGATQDEAQAPEKLKVPPVKLNNPPAKEATNSSAKEIKKEEKKSSSGKSKKKEDKSIEYILRALNSLQSPEEKLAALCKKYADLHEEHRVLQASFKTQQRTMTSILREKDQIQCEHAKAVVAKSKLESLCRELQKQNKFIKEESIQKAREDDEKRREISTKFQTTIGEIQTQMVDNNERNNKLREENLELASQLKKFLEQYELREKQVEKQRQHRELEQQLADAKIAQGKVVLKEEQERNAKEKELLLLKLADSNKKSTLLEAQLTVFKERYDEFETLHTKSNETFQKYKTEMDKMSKRIKRLEKDGLLWKSKWEVTNKQLTESYDARSKAEKETTMHIQKTKKLESLCRALQAELHNKKPEPAPAPAPAPTPESDVSKSKPKDAAPDAAAPPNTPENLSSSGQESPTSTAAETPNSDLSPNRSQRSKSRDTSSPTAPNERRECEGADGSPSDCSAPSQSASVPTAAATTTT